MVPISIGLMYKSHAEISRHRRPHTLELVPAHVHDDGRLDRVAREVEHHDDGSGGGSNSKSQI